MTLTFEYTVADIEEGAQAQGQFLTTGRVGKPNQTAQPPPLKFGSGLAGWVILVVMAILLVYLIANRQPTWRAGSAPAPLPTCNFFRLALAMAVPSLAVFSFMCFFIFRKMSNPIPFYSPSPSQQEDFLTERILFVFTPLIVGIGIIVCLNVLPATPNWVPTSTGMAFVASIPFAATFLFTWFYIFRKIRHDRGFGRLGPQGGWLRQVQKLEINQFETMIISNELFKTEWSWNFFVSYLESDNLFLLYNKDLNMHIIPKRAFPSSEALASFCKLIQSKIPKGQLLPPTSMLAANYSGHGFPVIPVK